MIEVEADAGVMRVWLARPEAKNALSRELVVELTRVFAEVARDPATRCVVVGGPGSGFWAGADLGEMREAGRAAFEMNVAEAQALQRLFEAVYECARPVIARVHGAALGGGAGLVAACDIPVAADDAKLG